jgi:hypothetical protein
MEQQQENNNTELTQQDYADGFLGLVKIVIGVGLILWALM